MRQMFVQEHVAQQRPRFIGQLHERRWQFQNTYDISGQWSGIEKYRKNPDGNDCNIQRNIGIYELYNNVGFPESME
jgi:hypothetical protein